MATSNLKGFKLSLQNRKVLSTPSIGLSAPASLSSGYGLSFPPALPTIGSQALFVDTAGNLSWNATLSNTTANSVAGLNNQNSAVPITGLIMTSTSFSTTNVFVSIAATRNQAAVFTLTVTVNAGGVYALEFFAMGDDTGIVFSINPVTAQISYTSPNISGFISLGFTWFAPKTITNFLPSATNSVFLAAAPQSTAANVTGLVSTITYAVVSVYVQVIAATNLYALFTLTIYSKGANGTSGYAIQYNSVGDDTGIVFSVVAASGQIQYTSPSFSSWVSTTLQWTNPATLTTTPTTLSSLALTGPLQVTNGSTTLGSSGGTLVTSVLSANSGSMLNIPAQIVQDAGTVASGTLSSYNHTYIGVPTLSATNTGVITTTASTVTIAGAPVAGTNETISNAYALNILSGNALINGALTVRSFIASTIPAYTTLAPQSPWVNFGSSYEPLSYAKIAGIVYIKGLLTLTNGGSATAVIATLPIGFRPINIKIFPAITYTNARVATCVEINPSGVITPNTTSGNATTNGGAGYVSLEFSFVAEQ